MTEKKECSKVMDKFLELDNNQHIPLWITKHLVSCPECRNHVRMLTQAQKILTEEGTSQDPFTYSAIYDVKEKIFPGSTKEKKVPFKQWLISGGILVFCMILGSVAVSKFFPEFQNISFIFVASALIAYCMLFIGMNIDKLSEK